MIVAMLVHPNGIIVMSKEFNNNQAAIKVVNKWQKAMGSTYKYFINNTEIKYN